MPRYGADDNYCAVKVIETDLWPLSDDKPVPRARGQGWILAITRSESVTSQPATSSELPGLLRLG